MKEILASELTLNERGKTYHLNLGLEDIADTIILVGDQDRVKLVASFFDCIRFETQHREFCTITGTYNGKEFSAISTGIGTDNIDIVLNELDAIVNIDFETRRINKKKRKLNFIRIGTCGSLQKKLKPGARILSKYAIGIDGLAHFYDIPFTDDEWAAKEAFLEITGWSTRLNMPYIKTGSNNLRRLINEDMVEGITVTACGFYGPQGRALRIPLTMSDFKERLGRFEWKGLSVANLEMECSGLYALSSALGHEAVTVCLVLANRCSGEFMSDYQNEMGDLIRDVLDRLTK